MPGSAGILPAPSKRAFSEPFRDWRCEKAGRICAPRALLPAPVKDELLTTFYRLTMRESRQDACAPRLRSQGPATDLTPDADGRFAARCHSHEGVQISATRFA